MSEAEKVIDVDKGALRHTLKRVQFASADSAPPRLSHPLPPLVAPQLIALFAVVSFALVLAFNRIPSLVTLFPERDLYFTRYEGLSSLPLRIFIISFCIAYACFIDARWSDRARFVVDLVAPFILFCAALDLCNVLAKQFAGADASLYAIGLASGLGGMLIFAAGVLLHANMPPRSDAPTRLRFKIGALATASVAIVTSAGISIWVDSLALPVLHQMRQIALLGGVSVGVFLFVPLLFFLLNIAAAVQSLYRTTSSFAPDITVVLPAHNEAHVIASTIAALDKAAANYRGSVTLIVVDNNSSDATQSVARNAFAEAKSLRTLLLEEKAQGKAHALNCGLNAVKTDFFARVDADTLLTPDALTRAFARFGRGNVGAVGGVALPPGGGPFDGAREIEIILKMGYDQIALGAADCIFGIPGMFACYSTEAARRAGGFACGMNGEDTDMALRIGEDGYRLIVDPSVIFLSEVPRTYEHLREQRHRWFRSIFHVSARNRQLLDFSTFTVRGMLVVPYMLLNTTRRAMAIPLLVFAIFFLIVTPDPRSSVSAASVVALLLGAPMLNAIIAVLVNLRFGALLALPRYIGFRMLRAYLTLEAILSMNYTAYSARGSLVVEQASLTESDTRN